MYTIICVDIKCGSDSPVIVDNYGILTKSQASDILNKIYLAETKEGNKPIKTSTYVGVLHDNDYDNELDRKEYYLMDLQVIKNEDLFKEDK